MPQDQDEQAQPLLSSDQRYGTIPATEQSPESTPAIHRSRSLHKTVEVCLVALGFLFFLFVFVTSIRDILPAPLPVTVTNTTGEFSGQHAWDAYLTHFATRPHSGSSKQILEVRKFIAETVSGLKKEAKQLGVRVELLLEDSVDFEMVGTEPLQVAGDHSYIQSTNILVKLVGQSNRSEALLISAHYGIYRVILSTQQSLYRSLHCTNCHFRIDSVPSSHGVTDNGIGLAVALEILRTLIHNPVKHTVIFNLNNFEEGGLFGSHGFMHHPWARNVRAFINLGVSVRCDVDEAYCFVLDSAGAGGRAILYRVNNLDLAKMYAAGAPTPHANVLGNDVYNAGAINSATDYVVYSALHNLSGIDIAFYTKRSHYHTTRDTLAYTTPSSVQHMGGVALSAARQIADSDFLIDPNRQQHGPSVYYDVLGIWAFAYSFKTYCYLDVAVLVLVALGAVYAVGVRLAREGDMEVKRVVRDVGWSAMVVGVGLAVVVVSFVGGLGMAILLIRWCHIESSHMANFLRSVKLTLHQPPTSPTRKVVYGRAYVCFLFTLTSTFLGVVLTQHLSTLLIHRFNHHIPPLARATRHGLLAFWWLLLLAAVGVAQRYTIGGFYWTIWFVGSAWVGGIVADTPAREVQGEEKRVWIAQLILEVFVPFVLLFDLIPFQIDGLRHTPADGSAEIMVYGFFALFSILIALPLIPTIHRAGNHTHILFSLTLTLLVLFAALSTISPYDSNHSPAKVLFQQNHDVATNISEVSLIAAAGLDLVMRTALEPAEYAKVTCAPFPGPSRGPLTRCAWRSDKVPTYFSGPNETREEEFKVEVLNRTIVENGTVVATVRVRTQSAVQCRVDFDQKGVEIQTAWVHGFEKAKSQKEQVRALVSVRREFDRPWEFSVRYVEGKNVDSEKRVKARVACFYEEWYEGKLPAFVDLMDAMPPWALLAHRGNGLASAWWDVIV
ncbi:hypothetical protein BC937DRAFT_94036 [Endogone sp. FLAS-F59071]|nr:hypothetical protein BC937DRAFT_94036 [Endogone sp. FLAS-F59071]|eukprot:RUS20915.1 hypothetical protein BC937DRAFT_94036 [Endogone sp. FLAS-F59071]